MATSSASGSTKGSDVLLGLKQRLLDALGKGPVVRIVVAPNPKLSQYRAEQSVALRFPPPEPQTTAGAGRYGQPVVRTLQVYVGTENLSDQAGEDEALALAHLDFEEQVINALVDAAPGGSKLGISVRFVPGGAEIERDVKQDVGMAYSVLLFEVKYQQAYTVAEDGN